MLLREFFVTIPRMALISCLLTVAMPQVNGEDQVAWSAQQICPVMAGTKIPNTAFTEIDGTTLDLMSRVSQKPTVLIFYRGGW